MSGPVAFEWRPLMVSHGTLSQTMMCLHPYPLDDDNNVLSASCHQLHHHPHPDDNAPSPSPSPLTTTMTCRPHPRSLPDNDMAPPLSSQQQQ